MFSLKTVGFDKILDIISKYSICELGRDKIRSLKPSSDRSIIELSLEKLKEVYRLSNYDIDFVPPIINDVYPLLKKISIANSYIEPFELNEIRQNVKSFIFLRKIIVPYSKECLNLGTIFKNIIPPYNLVRFIDDIVDDSGSLRDDASEKLISVNERIKSLKRNIEKTLQNYFSSSETKDYIQEPTITIKNDRYVIPLKHSYMGKVPGVVHAHSGSDQTVFVEPFTITDQNNEIKVLEKERDKEIRRILKDCSLHVHKIENELMLIQDILVDIDFIHSKLSFMKEYPSIFPDFLEQRSINIRGGRHPLIKGKVVPLNIEVDKDFKSVVVTGPNTGGKTVLLKTVGLFICMAQSALPVPADEYSSLIFENVFAEIGDEQSIEQSLSTFSAHIKHIKNIVDMATSESIVLIDELGAGTDPIEGGAIGTAILDYMRKKNILTVVTTHLSMIKMYALEHYDVLVASVQFDPKTLKPTYRVVLGVPGRSNALEIAEMLGLQKDILDITKSYMIEKDRSFDNVLKRLSEFEVTLVGKESDLLLKRKEVNERLKDYQEKSRSLSEKEMFYKSKFQREVEDLISYYRKKLENVIHSVIESGASKQAIKDAKLEIEGTRKYFDEYDKNTFNAEKIENEKEITIGSDVRVKTKTGQWVKGSVIKKNGEKITLRTGLIKMVVPIHDIYVLDNEEKKNERENINSKNYDVETVGNITTTCDIRGKRYEEAMEEVKRFLDKALLTNIEEISIIHGLGTGALRKGVWDYLKYCNFITKYYYARPEDGGFGCTIVEFKR